MKFAKVLQEKMVADDVPQEWLEAAIQYKALKKCISRVVNELRLVGLEQNTLKLLLDKIEVNEEETTAANPVIARYVLNKTNEHEVVPTLKIILDYNQELTDDHINTSIEILRKKLETIVNGSSDDEQVNGNNEDEDSGHDDEVFSPKTTVNKLLAPGSKYEISIRLGSDTKFFSMLNEELNNLDNFKNQEEDKMLREIQEVGALLNNITSNSSIKKSDIYTWRQLFKMFLDSEIYFKYNNLETQSSEKSLEQVRNNMDKYTALVNKTELISQFKNKKSLNAFKQFMAVNEYLLKVLEFQSINSTAFTKILKKFDKRTSLNVKGRLPKLISNDHIFFSGMSLTQKICYTIQSSLLQVVPQLDDYTCPICLEVAFKPIKLDCGHIFCVRCLVKMKAEEKYDCPICRSDKVVQLADGANLDVELMEKMQKFFPNEVKQKIKDRDKERVHDSVGDVKCVIV